MRFLPFVWIFGLLPAAVGEASGAEQRPNVLLIVADDLAACLGSYGHPVCRTPHLDRLAREGVRFERAYCQFPVCGPSRSSFMSGLYPASTRMLGNSRATGAFKASNPALADHPSIGGLLRRHGYVSARVSKIYHMGVPRAIEAGSAEGDDPDSWDWTANVLAAETTGPERPVNLSPGRADAGTAFATVVVPDERAPFLADALAARQAIAFLESRVGPVPADGEKSGRLKPGAPFFLAVGFVRPHVPFVVPARCLSLYPPERTAPPAVPAGDADDVPTPALAMRNAGRYDLSDDGKRRARAGYFAAVTFMDEQVGALLDALDRLDLRRETIVVFVSDHGYALGEHDLWQKLGLFEETTRVPFLVSAPEFRDNAGRTATGVVELLDLYPTIADLAGLGGSIPQRVQGTSLRPLLADPTARRPTGETAYTVSHLGASRSAPRGGGTPSGNPASRGRAKSCTTMKPTPANS